jgi:L,D-peptidoglycan transpeptidase YkuD (ErfK/YbiS/YcfS/YnhG family)
LIDLRVDGAARVLHAAGVAIPCTLGRAGVCAAAAKQEGDGATPAGTWRLRGILLRRDRINAAELPAIMLPWRWLRANDGWSDDPADPAYNRPVNHPHRHSAERLWRDDGVYDVIVVLGHNDAPPVAGQGSAIFWHLTNPDQTPTEGCIAIDRAAMLALLPTLTPTMALAIG